MTAPDVDGPVVPDEESLAYEAATVALVTASVGRMIRDLIASMLAAFDAATRGGAMSAETAASFGRSTALAIRRLRWPPMDPRLQRAMRDGRDLGVIRAVRAIEPGPTRDLATTTSWRATGAELPAVSADRALSDKLTEAARLASTLNMGKRGSVLAVAGRTSSGLAHAEGTARWSANEAINAGTAAVAETTGLNLVWVAERGACLHCLAHAGWVIAPGGTFPGVSYDLRARNVPAVRWPPLHPNCRCQVRTYDGPAGAPSRDRDAVDPAARLAAEARRSVVYQWTDHASKIAAERAAVALLQVGAALPASVEDRARRAVRRGKPVRRPK